MSNTNTNTNANVSAGVGALVWCYPNPVTATDVAAQLPEHSNLIPAAQGPTAAIHATLRRGNSAREMVRSIKSTYSEGHVLVRESAKDATGNQYTDIVAVTVSDPFGKVAVVGDLSRWDDAEYERQRTLISAAKMARFVASVLERIGGVTVKSKSGVYWIPADKITEVETFRAKLDTIPGGHSGGCSLGIASILGDYTTVESLARAVADNMGDEVAAAIASTDTRKVADVVAKIESFKRTLPDSESLTKLADTVRNARTARITEMLSRGISVVT